MSADDPDGFSSALRGESSDPALAKRLGDLLREQQGHAAQEVDEVTRRRVWQQLSSSIDADSNHASTHNRRAGWSRRAALAQAAVFAIVGIALGYFIGAPNPQAPPQIPHGRLEFAYGDLEVSRGSILDTVVTVEDPVEAMRPLTEALIGDRIAFEIHSVTGRAARRLIVTLPNELPPLSAAAFQRLNVTAVAGRGQAILFAKRSDSGQ